MKIMLITFFDHQGLVQYELVFYGQIVNQHLYEEVRTCLVCQEQGALWASETWVLHHDNVPALTSLDMKQLLVSKQITTLNHQPYSLDLASCDFFLFLKSKGIIKGVCFKKVDDIKTNATAHIKSIEKREFEECFRSWSTRVAKCVEVYGKYFGCTIRGHIRVVHDIQG